ncbi:MAG: NAD-dependent epimerase/dehydratase family protein [Gammaproteobacteria bacterium]
MARILIIGCGGIGAELGRRLAGEGHFVTGLKRHPPASNGGIHYRAADITQPHSLEALAGDSDQIVFIVSADGRTESSYRAVYETGLDHALHRFSGIPWFFVSSTSVYGQNQGEWVDEDSEASPHDLNARLIREAEKKVAAARPDNVVVRFSGIYGPGREHLLRLAAGSPAIQKDPPYYTNRIHQRDCVGVLSFLLSRRLSGASLDRCYLASDDDPAPMWDVVSWLAERRHCPPPTIKEAGKGAPMNKRCRNARLKALGYRFRYPGFRDGYGELLADR